MPFACTTTSAHPVTHSRFFTAARSASRLIPLILLLFSATLFANLSPRQRSHLDSLTQIGKEQIYNLRMTTARETFARIHDTYPAMPQGAIYTAYINVILYGLNKSSDSLASEMIAQIEVAQDAAEAYRSANPEVAEAHFYVGVADGMRGLIHVMNRNYLRGYFSGRSAKGSLEKTVELDSTFYDAFIGLGMVHYYADLLPGVLKFFAGVLGFKGDRQLGVREIQLTATNGTTLKYEAQFILHMIRYFLEGNRSSSVRKIEAMYRKFPGNHGLGLFLSYHHRRNGEMEKCIRFCEAIHDVEPEVRPLIEHLKNYNLAVARYRLNQFAASDSIFNLMEQAKLPPSTYYRAGISYYRGLIADLNGDRRRALAYYNRIPDDKETQFWTSSAEMPRAFAMDSLMREYHRGANLLYTRRLAESAKIANALVKAFESGKQSDNPDFEFLAHDLAALNYHFRQDLTRSKASYDVIVPRLDDMKSEFNRAWIWIHYARLQRDLNEFEAGLTSLEQAKKYDDDYTRLIVSRERFVIKKRMKRHKSESEKSS